MWKNKMSLPAVDSKTSSFFVCLNNKCDYDLELTAICCYRCHTLKWIKTNKQKNKRLLLGLSYFLLHLPMPVLSLLILQPAFQLMQCVRSPQGLVLTSAGQVCLWGWRGLFGVWASALWGLKALSWALGIIMAVSSGMWQQRKEWETPLENRAVPRRVAILPCWVLVVAQSESVATFSFQAEQAKRSKAKSGYYISCKIKETYWGGLYSEGFSVLM